MQINTKTEYIISLNHDEMTRLKRIIELALQPMSDVDITKEMEELALEILENIKE
jgi:hypothetical protein